MDGKAKERWCMLRWEGGSKDKTVNIDRMMLRFRPIAPKPAVGGAASDSSPADNKSLLFNNKRSKRRYRVRKTNNGYSRRKNTTTSGVNGSKDGMENKIVTLQLLPERADVEDQSRGRPWCNYVDKTSEEKVVSVNKEQATWLKNQVLDDMVRLEESDQTVVVMPQRRVLETLVTVESVTETCTIMDYSSRRVGSVEAEIMMNLEKDTCPAFISDGLNRVQWVNDAYKRMVMVNNLEKEAGQSETESAETVTVLVLLVMKDNHKFKLLSQLSSFTCRVRVQYTWKKEKYSKMVPCDVWRLMEFGGLAWRLDVEAALSLGR